MSRVLVTGASGFIGRILCKQILRHDHEVRCAVRNSSISEGLPGHVVVMDEIGSNTNWEKIFEGVFAIVHLAARVHVTQDSARDPLEEYRKVNSFNTERLAYMAAASSVKRFIYISSIGVNGKSTNNTSFTENDLPNPFDSYTLSKWEAEKALKKVEIETGLEVVVIRPPLVYGPGNPGNFIRLLQWVNSGLPLPLASVANLRSFVYVENLVDAIISCLDHPVAANQTYLVSDGKDISTSEIIQLLANLLDKPARLLTIPTIILRLAGKLVGKSTDVDRLLDSLVIDSSKIRRELGWVPPYSMGQGLKETVDWFKLR